MNRFAQCKTVLLNDTDLLGKAYFVMLNSFLSFQATFGMATFCPCRQKWFCANDDLVAF